MFIEINNHLTVNIKQISWVASADEGISSTVKIGDEEYPCDIPYQALVNMLKQASGNPIMDKLDKYLSVATVTQL